jgi:hypothetical protein
LKFCCVKSEGGNFKVEIFGDGADFGMKQILKMKIFEVKQILKMKNFGMKQISRKF